ncbi:MAG TPA: dienelactone hydrolase family protein [Verrucomicrobiaceae bacterium]
MRTALLLALVLVTRQAHSAATTLPGTTPLEAASGDERSRAMVAGIDRMALQLIDDAARQRHLRWKSALADAANREAYLRDMREKLRVCIGLVDEIVPNPGLQKLSADPADKPLAETAEWSAWFVRWPVFDGVDGSGILLKPKNQVRACVVCIPDADETPQSALFNRHSLVEAAHHGTQLASLGCEVVVPMLINHDCAASGVDRFKVKTNVPHREWIYRQTFNLGRNITGFEVASMLALVDALQSANLATHPPVGLAGHGEGGWLALFTAALNENVKSTWVSRCFLPRESIWQEPLDRNAFNFVTHFGSAELGAMILPRQLRLSFTNDPREYTFENAADQGRRAVAAPFKLGPYLDTGVKSEIARLNEIAGGAGQPAVSLMDGAKAFASFLADLGIEERPAAPAETQDKVLSMVSDDWQFEQVRQMQDFSQRLIPVCEQERNTTFWKNLPLTPLQAYEKKMKTERERFWNEVIGRLPDPSVPMNSRSRLISENDAFSVHEVMLDVWPGVYAWGYLLLPKDLKAGERRPVVVCQHGLEGLPEDVVNEDEKSKAWGPYKGFAAKLARQGFITFAPHNFYRGKDDFRVIQRKLNLTGKTLFSVILGQHQRILEWLKIRPDVDPKRIAFYGLSYGGKSAMRIPSILTDYCLSICSGDFNEWVRKCVCLDMPMCYVFTHEYEIWEWNLGRTFNYAEMAALIAPRPFMVERGHNDGVGLDEWVSYEYAKVRRLYDKIGVGDRTQIEFFEGPHTINGKGTYEFLHQWLNWPAK